MLIGSGSYESISPLYIVAEGAVVLSLPGMDLARSVVLLLGTFYSFNVQYPKNGKSFFTFMEAVLMVKSHEAKKRVVVNKLLQDLHAL